MAEEAALTAGVAVPIAEEAEARHADAASLQATFNNC